MRLAPTIETAQLLLEKLHNVKERTRTLKFDLEYNFSAIKSTLSDIDNTTDDSLQLLANTLRSGGSKAQAVLSRLRSAGAVV